MLRVPRHYVDAIMVGPGAEGDGCYVLARLASGVFYYLPRAAGQKVLGGGIRSVRNLIGARDPADPAWAKSAGGAGSPPVVDTAWYRGPDGAMSARRVSFDAGGATSADASYLTYATNLPLTVRRVASVWLKSADGSSQKIMLGIGDTSTPTGTFTVDGTWRRYAAYGAGNPWASPRLVLFARGDVQRQVAVLMATDIDHCPMLESPIPAAQLGPSEETAPDVDYGTGAPGIRLSAVAHAASINPDGTVAEGAPSVLPGGGLALADASECLVAPTSPDLSASTAWHHNSADRATTEPGHYLAGLPCSHVTPNQTTPNNSGVFGTWAGTTPGRYVLRYWLDKNAGKLIVGHGSGPGDTRTWIFDAATGSLTPTSWSDGGTVHGTFVADLGDCWFVELDLEALGTNNPNQVRTALVRFDANTAPFFAHVEAYPYPAPSRYMAVHAPGTARTARGSDLTPLRWRPGTGWSPGRRLVCRLDVDTSLGVSEGTLLGGVDAGGTYKVPLIRVNEYAGEHRVTVTDGTNTKSAPIALPAGQPVVTVQVDAGPAGLRVAVDGTEYTDQTRFDFSWVSESYIGQRPDGSDVCPMPINIRPESWT